MGRVVLRAALGATFGLVLAGFPCAVGAGAGGSLPDDPIRLVFAGESLGTHAALRCRLRRRCPFRSKPPGGTVIGFRADGTFTVLLSASTVAPSACALVGRHDGLTTVDGTWHCTGSSGEPKGAGTFALERRRPRRLRGSP